MRKETDSMGDILVKDQAYWGAQTQRAIENFQVSKKPMPLDFIYALAIVKLACAQANKELGLLEETKANAIIQACEEILDHKFDDQFPVDVYQTGSGTSTNMNTNEVIANRAVEILGGQKGQKLIHPNNDVNKGQSSNDTIPTAMHIMIVKLASEKLLPALNNLEESLEHKEKEFYNIVKIGRTHMQDAVPMRLSDEFGAYKTQIINNKKRIEFSLTGLRELALGATAIGTGLNAPKGFAKLAIEKISQLTNVAYKHSPNLFEAIASKDSVNFFASSLSTLASSMIKIASDIRFLSCGPRCGIGELILKDLQPGSSIMPGKVNPVIPESVLQVSYSVIGYTQIINLCAQAGVLELNVMMPAIIYHINEAINIMSNVINDFSEKCIMPLRANKERINSFVENSLALVTPLALIIGYDAAAAIAHEAYLENKTIKEVVLAKGILTKEQVEEILDPHKMI
ncbi:Fumarate hydratase class 2 [Desulfurella amilsii]|uniref:Fumarate hydratase class II n=1 Tax=Desulfurella amilsii TaxID=1562698 RepID=A0A1X4XX39_9BACT|nr:class II fumarate hydratase [Desulfurella amilsii]OSS42084.1 Fumarate hydratase class 2 [Desulfurella amilsii]